METLESARKWIESLTKKSQRKPVCLLESFWTKIFFSRFEILSFKMGWGAALNNKKNLQCMGLLMIMSGIFTGLASLKNPRYA